MEFYHHQGLIFEHTWLTYITNIVPDEIIREPTTNEATIENNMKVDIISCGLSCLQPHLMLKEEQSSRFPIERKNVSHSVRQNKASIFSQRLGSLSILRFIVAFSHQVGGKIDWKNYPEDICMLRKCSRAG